MSFNCPACRYTIRHSETEPMPRRGVIYRCPICRLELVVDEGGTSMTLAPLAVTSISDARNGKATSAPVSRADAADGGHTSAGHAPAPRRRQR